MKRRQYRMPQPGDYVSRDYASATIGKKHPGPLRGRVRRINDGETMALIEWRHADICTWAFLNELQVTYRRRGAA